MRVVRGVLISMVSLFVQLPVDVRAQGDVDILVRSVNSGGGALVAQFDFDAKAQVFQSVCIGGQCLFSSTDPGFRTPPDAAGGAFPLNPGASVGLEIVALHAGASVKVGSTVLNAAGQSATLGSALSLHVHPSWQVTLPVGQAGDFPVTFRLTTTAPGYSPSASYTLVLTNGSLAASPTPTATLTPALPSPTQTALPTMTTALTMTATRRVTPTPTRAASPTPTPRDGPLPGDATCDDRVTAADLLELMLLAADPPPILPCGADALPDGVIDEGDIDFVVNAIFDR